jgi:glycosyltransferase involved in cell wall biosynthesis
MARQTIGSRADTDAETRKKKVLMIAYSFPPIGGSGVHRVLRFIKYLPEFGWLPTVVTTANNRYSTKDVSLLNHIPPKTDVIRIPGFEFLNYYSRAKKFQMHRVLSLIDKVTAFPDSQAFWKNKVIAELPKIIDIGSFDLIYATYGPGSNLLIGKNLKSKYHLPLVIDFRDEWASDPYLTFLRARARKPLLAKLEGECIRSSDRVVCLNEIMKDRFTRKYTDEARGKFVVIQNGYDEDTVKLQGEPKDTTLEPDKFNIIYAGSFYGMRNPGNFLKALLSLVNENQSYEKKIRVFFIGNVATPEVLNFAEQKALKKVVTLIPYLPHDELIRYLHSAHVLLLIIAQMPGTDAEYTSKIFEYIAVDKPILAIVPTGGAAAQLIRKTRTGFVVDNSNIEEIKKTIEALYENWKVGKLAVKPDRSEVMSYSAKNLTAKLADVFNDCVIRF